MYCKIWRYVSHAAGGTWDFNSLSIYALTEWAITQCAYAGMYICMECLSVYLLFLITFIIIHRENFFLFNMKPIEVIKKN